MFHKVSRNLYRNYVRNLLFAASFLLTFGLIPQAFAHPMGNFSVNHYSKLSFDNDGLHLSYIIDLAEIPAYQELQEGNIPADAANAKVTRYVASRGVTFGRGLALSIDGKPVTLRLISSQVIFPAGAGGLPTMKMGFVYQATYPAGATADGTLQYNDNNYPGHAGWKEIVAAAAAGFTGRLTSGAGPRTDRSAGLTNYPTDMLNSPPQDLSATVPFQYPAPAVAAESRRSPAASGHVSGAPVVSPAHAKHPSLPSHPLPPAVTPAPVSAAPIEAMHLQANQQATPRSAFTELITTRNLSFWFLLGAAFIALGLGALHALEPGHGKTIAAAYLVGSRGTARHAVLLGLIVTASHTAGVFALGAITLYASRYIVPEQLYPWLGVFSGLTIAALGGYMFLRRWTGLDVDHTHTAGQMHGHWFSSKKSIEAAPAVLQPAKTVSLSQLFVLGITGGIIPCPAALVVLLSAFSLHRIGLGFFLITAFSLGLATVLIAFGMAMVYGRRFMARLQVDGPLTKRWLPVASAGFMTLLGAGIAVRAFFTTGIGLHNLSQNLTREKLGPFLFIGGVGLLLGMRHSTDADHVVAVSTIVSKQNSIRSAGIIGTIWGLGHTLTIFVVGSLIILFGVVIPPRVGLSMEFSVGLMLILLGVLNLTGVMQRMTSWLSRGNKRNQGRKDLTSRTESLLDQTVGRFGMYQCVRPLVIGIVHGLAGSAAVALLVLSTIHNPLWATVYLLIFGAGTMVGMMGMTSVMALPLAYAGKRFANMSRVFSVASGIVSVCFGFFLVYQLGFLGGLFTTHPQWTPR